MPTVIDSIQIEIQSNSASASSGIDSFVGSLERLKKSSTTTVVVKHLNNLSAAVRGFSDASRASSAMGELAGAIERLKKVGSIASIANNLTKLPAALKAIEGVDGGRMASQFRSITDASKELAGIKTSGLNSMVNSLSKITKVTKELDDAKIAAFAARVKKLNETLAPLSEKMKNVGSGFAAINAGAGKALESTKKFDHGIHTSSLNLSSFIEVARTAVQTVAQLIQRFVEFLSVAIEWDGIKAQFGNAFGDQADEYYEKITKITDALMINKQAFMENSAMAASMLTGFGVDKTDAREMGLGYTQLAYDIWAAYNNVYKTLDGADGAMAAVRSAIAGEVEPIRRAGFTIIESTLEQTAAQHGLNISIEKATEAQKSYLRYLTLVDQAQSKGVIGTYAREMSTAEGMMRTFSQQLKSLAQAFGSLFLPILTKVMPYFQAFIELLTDGVRAIAAFFGIKIQDIGDTWYDYSTSVDSAAEGTEAVTGALGDAEKAAKALKNASIGIDELNVISPSSASAGGSGGGAGGDGGAAWDGLDVESLWDESIFNDIKDQVDSIKKKFEDWAPAIAAIAGALGAISLANMIDDLDLADTKLGKFETKIKGLAKGIAVGAVTIAVGTLIWDFTGAYLDEGGLKNLGKMLGTTVIGAAIGAWFGKSAGAGLVIAASGVVSLSKLVVELKEGSVEISDPEALTTMIVGALETALGGALIIDGLKGGKWTKAIGDGLLGGLKNAFSKLSLSSITAALSKIPGWGWIAAAVLALIAGAWYLALADYDFKPMGEKFGYYVGLAFKYLTPVGWVITLGQLIKKAWEGAVEWLEKNFDITTIEDFAAFIFNPKSWSDIIVPKMKEIGKNAIGGLWDGISGMWNNFWKNVGEFIDGFVKGFEKALGINSESKVFADIGKNIVDGLLKPLKLDTLSKRLTEIWNAAKRWWDSKPKLKEYTPTIGSIYEKVKERWDNARTWYNDKKSKMKEYTPSIGSIYEKAKERWDNARIWWNDKKTAMKTYTPSIGSIVDKVKSAWNTAKSWWSKNVGDLSTTLNIKVPKIEVKWKTAEAFGKSFKYPSGFSLKFAADGGIFDAGSLIWAGERGAEVVANAGGGKTGVMNVQQMQDAVYEGVFAAMSAVMSRQGGDGSQSVNVYLDSRQITSTVERRQHEKGASILGNEVFA